MSILSILGYMSSRYCSLMLVFCLVFATLMQSGYSTLMGMVEDSSIELMMHDAHGDEGTDQFPIENDHDDENFQIVDLLETEPHLNYPHEPGYHSAFNSKNNSFEFLDRCIIWHSDNTSPPPEV